MELFEKLDFVAILSIGISGFGLLLIMMAFLLIYREQAREGEPRKGILSTIRFFMLANFVTIVVVGIFGLPAIIRNVELKNENGSLKIASKQDKATIGVLNEGQKFDSLVIQSLSPETPNIKPGEAAEVIKAYTNSLDTLQNKIGDKAINDSIASIRMNLSRYADDLKQGRIRDSAHVQQALKDIMVKRYKVNDLILKDSKKND